MAEKVVWVDVDDLGIDTTNIRGGRWDYDDEFVKDIKKNKILNPLLVRRAAPKTRKKYAVVCGSRRYNAAIEAGLKKVPCFIEEMDDVTALGRTIAENKHREDIPAWMFAVRVGEMFERLDHKGEKSEIIKIIMGKTGLSDTTIREYIDAYELPSVVFALLKEPAERSKKEREMLKSSALSGEIGTLSLEKGAIIRRELFGQVPKGRMLDFAVFVLDKAVDAVRELARLVKTYPKMSMEDIFEKYTGIPKGTTWRFYFDSNLVRAIDEACVRKQVDRVNLVTGYVKKGLKDDGFL